MLFLCAGQWFAVRTRDQARDHEAHYKNGENRDAETVRKEGDGAKGPTERDHEDENRSEDGKPFRIAPVVDERDGDCEGEDDRGEDCFPDAQPVLVRGCGPGHEDHRMTSAPTRQ